MNFLVTDQQSKSNHIPLSKLAEGLQQDGVDAKYDGKSLRLHASNNGKSFRLNVHTKLDNIFGFGRAERRRDALTVVKDALKSEYKLSDATVKHLMSTFQSKPDRISYAELKALSAHAQQNSRILAADAKVAKAMNSLNLTRAEAETLVGSFFREGAIDQSQLDAIDQKLDTLIGLQSHAQDIENAMGEAMEVAVGKRGKLSDKAEQSFQLLSSAYQLGIRNIALQRAKILPPPSAHPKLTALQQQIGTETQLSNANEALRRVTDAKSGITVYSQNPAVQKLVANLGPSNGTILDNLQSAAKNRIAELKKAAFDNNGQQRVSAAAVKWKNVRTDPNAVSPHAMTGNQLNAFKQSGITPQLGTNANLWIPASSGTSGALIVKDPANPSANAVLKYEESSKSQATGKLSNLLTATIDILGGPKQAPFEVSGAVEVKLDDEGLGKTSVDNLKTTLAKVKDSAPDEKKAKIQKHIDKLSAPNPTSTLTKQPLVDGVDLSKLPPEDKIALIKSPQFGQDMGAVLGTANLLGLDDHLSINVTGEQNFKEGLNNLSNIMLSSKTGKPVLIDLGNQVGADDAAVKMAYQSLTSYLNALKTPADIEKAVSDAANAKSGIGTSSPVANAVKAFFEPADDNLFSASEHLIANSAVTEADKKTFAANFLLGVVNSLESIAAHKDQITTAASKDSLMQNPKQLLDDVVGGIGDYTTLKSALQNYVP